MDTKPEGDSHALGTREGQFRQRCGNGNSCSSQQANTQASQSSAASWQIILKGLLFMVTTDLQISKGLDLCLRNSTVSQHGDAYVPNEHANLKDTEESTFQSSPEGSLSESTTVRQGQNRFK